MKNIYEKPEVELLQFEISEPITDEGGEVFWPSSEEGMEEW